MNAIDLILILKIFGAVIGFWITFCLSAAAAGHDVMAAMGHIQAYRTELEQCHVYGQCPLQDSSFHRWREQKEWNLVKKYPKYGVHFALVISLFVQLFLLPVDRLQKIFTGKEFV